MTPKTFATKILRWFDLHGRKNLPWQQNKTAYRVWVSEIMLQQTQVKTVIPYFENFMRRFPNVESLASATLDEVLKHWAGLGYYSRGRNLHKTANMIMEQHAGIFPDSLEVLQTLAGIGRSTAGAISAIAFDQPTAILDGNVKRLLSRFHGVTESIYNKKVEAKLWELATAYMPKTRAADYTQAMMDMGATLCTRSKPNCTACPLQKNCLAYINHLTHVIPQKRTSKTLPEKTVTFLIIRNKQSILLHKKPAPGIWGGLWCFPEITGKPHKTHIKKFCKQSFNTELLNFETLTPFRHTFSHYHLHLHPVIIQLDKVKPKMMEGNNEIWYNLKKPLALGLPKPIATLIGNLK